jgi:hypothetical protein
VDAEVFGDNRCVDYIARVSRFWPIRVTEMIERLVSTTLVATKPKIPI